MGLLVGISDGCAGSGSGNAPFGCPLMVWRVHRVKISWDKTSAAVVGTREKKLGERIKNVLSGVKGPPPRNQTGQSEVANHFHYYILDKR